jgi:hypothetical protein
MRAGRTEEGAVLVEFALVLVPLALLVFGVMHFGLMLNAKIDETHLTNEGARYAAVNHNPSSTDALQDYILEQATTEDLRNNAVLCVDYPDLDGDPGGVGDPVRFTMTYTYELLPDLILGGVSVPIESEAWMRLEAVPDDIPAGCSS